MYADDAWLWQAFADDSADHRNVTDPDVACVIHAVCQCAELDRLNADHRDLCSQWDRP